MIDFFRRMFCKHDWRLVAQGRLFYDDSSMSHGSYRSYVCEKCCKSRKLRF
jgi:hypothetical protein